MNKIIMKNGLQVRKPCGAINTDGYCRENCETCDAEKVFAQADAANKVIKAAAAGQNVKGGK
jgi:hypothetical protein